MNPSQLIALLNALHFGDLDSITRKLKQAEAACRELGNDEIVERIVLAREAIAAADAKSFRKHTEAAVSKLGHLR